MSSLVPQLRILMCHFTYVISFSVMIGNIFREWIAWLTYMPTITKVSSIIHPTLKANHCIFSSIIFPRNDISNAGQKEFELLWYLIHNLKWFPDFGLLVTFKLLKLSRSTSGQLHYGGMITFILKHPTLSIHFPHVHNVIERETRLTTNVFKNIHMFHIEIRDAY